MAASDEGGNDAGDRDGARGASGDIRMSAPADEARRPGLPFPVVGVGASAGGLEAYSEFLQAVPADSGMGYVLIQHLPPDRESMLVEILAQKSRVPVSEIEDGQAVVPNHVYCIRPGNTVTIRDGRLRLGPVLEARGHARPVDDFFRSLAEEQQERAIAVVLSGMGSNGTAGAQAVKAVGGICVAQDPESAKFPSMPRSLIDNNLADYVARPGDVPEILARYAAHPYVAGTQSEADLVARDKQALADVLAVLRSRTRRDFGGYRKPTLLRRIRRRMGLQHVEEIATYVQMLRRSSDEVTALADDLLIHVTGFFRDPVAWAALAEKVLAPLVEERPSGTLIRAWVAACSTGEEAYTLAMLLTEAAEAANKRFDIKVFATDMADRALAHARAGAYPNGIESDISPERLDRFFDRENDSVYRAKRALRELVVFAPQNVLSDPPFSRLDLITCRNLLIYLEPEVQRKTMALFHFGLRDGGSLMLGTSESIGATDGEFETVDKPHRLYRRVGPGRLAPDLPLAQLPRAAKAAGDPARSIPLTSVGQVAGRVLLEHHTPAAVVVDSQGQVVYYHGDTARYLDRPPGAATHDLLTLANDQVRGAVRTALSQAVAQQKAIAARDCVVDTPRGRRRTEVGAMPLDSRLAQPCYLVTFADHLEVTPRAAPPAADDVGSADRQLVSELQGVSDELQTALEEMRASHEEVTSINEELQSTNEELETSKEEMQSLNEELITVNAQVQAKVLELEVTTGDLASLLSSTDIAVLFLDPQLRIRRYTPAVRDLIDLIPSDIDRPLANLVKKFADPELAADCKAVLARQSPTERDVLSDSGRTYVRRTLPYRTADDRTGGVVVTFVDVTERRLAEGALRASEEQFRRAIQDAPIPIVMQADDGRVLQVSRTWTELTGYELADMPNAEAWLTRAFGPGADAVRAYTHELFRGDRKTLNVEFVIRTRAGEERNWSYSASAPGMLGDGRRFLVGMAVDVTERKRAEERQAFLLVLADALRPLGDPAAIQAEACLLLGEQLGADRAGYAETGPNRELLVVRRDWCRPGVASVAGEYRVEEFGQFFAAPLREGRAVQVEDAANDPQVSPETYVGSWAAIGARSGLAYGIVKSDRPAAALFVHLGSPRRWLDAEVDLVRETAERVWAAVERARTEAALAEVENRYRLMVENIADHAIIGLDAAGRVSTWNESARRLFGYSAAEIVGQFGGVLMTPEDRTAARFERELETSTLTGRATDDNWVARRDGSLFWADGSMSAVRDGTGALTGFVKVVRDRTEQRAAAVESDEGRERLRIAAEAAGVGIWRWDVGGDVHIRDANLNRMLGLPAVETVFPLANFIACMHPDDRATVGVAFAESAQRGRYLSVEFRVVWPDGTIRWLRDQGDVFEGAGGEGRYLTGAGMDVTDLKQLEEGLRAARDGLESRVAERTSELAAAVAALETEMARRRDLARRLATAQEDERRRVSRDLHDTVGQTHAGLAMALKAAADAPPGEAAARLAAARDLVNTMGRELHAAAMKLRPTALDDIGLAAAARELVANWSAQHDTPAEFDASGFGEGRASADAETALYRAVQEALTNVARHAKASRVSVSLVRADGHAAAVVEDDGAGFDPESAGAGRLGLLGMRERMELAGGTLEVESTPGAGTTVIARVPALARSGE